MLEILVVPSCFVAAALIGHRLGTPGPVAAGLGGVGVAHLAAFLVGDWALAASGSAAALLHLLSQTSFMAGFVALVWLAGAYPDARPSPRLWLPGWRGRRS